MSKSRFPTLLRALLGAAILLALGYAVAFKNDRSLWRMSRSLSLLRHPPGTQSVASARDVGLLVGNGNHCDFLVMELRSHQSTSLTPAQIRAFYRGAKIPSPFGSGGIEVSILTIENGAMNEANSGSLEEQMRSYFGRLWPQKLGSQKLYVLMCFDVGHDAGCDIRCI